METEGFSQFEAIINVALYRSNTYVMGLTLRPLLFQWWYQLKTSESDVYRRHILKIVLVRCTGDLC